MKTTTVELSDGRALSILGGDAESTARALAQYLGQAPAPAGENSEEVLPLPVMDFGTTDSTSGNAIDQLLNVPNREEVVPLPIMNFDKKPAAPSKAIAPAGNQGDEEVLPLPVMDFQRR